MPVDRREFLRQLSLLGAAVASFRCGRLDGGARGGPPDAGTDAPELASAPLTARQRACLAAACERILPTDAAPGAKEAGVIEFCDSQLRRPELADIKRRVVGGLLALDRRAGRAAPGKSFVDLSAEEQDQLLAETQRGSAQGDNFLRILISITLEGFLSDPAYGGNKGRMGWDFIGYAPCSIEEGKLKRSHAGHGEPGGRGEGHQ